WIAGTFGCVRTEGWQMHEGLDIRCLQRDKRGEPLDPVLATADGEVAYINTRAGYSNYGIYMILRHRVEGIEVYSIYAHLREVRAGLKVGAPVKAGEQIAMMGHTTNTRQGISKDRAHVHFELSLLLNDHFAAWYRKTHPGERNDHGDWNGQNLLAMDPREILLTQKEHGSRFSLLNYIRQQPELFRVLVRDAEFPWLRRYAPLVLPNPRLGTNTVAGYEIACNFNGIPIALFPHSASDFPPKGSVKLVSVNEAEYQRNHCRKLVTKRGTHWELTQAGAHLIDLLTFSL
ncbi:MAG TPA: M23 family metallopeptidase, partial [Verrucomicrobiae bacterium]|nr:M23 family metallopeptidase [Verrucomicrobiae bacterium]